jgi:hypothetical protein
MLEIQWVRDVALLLLINIYTIITDSNLPKRRNQMKKFSKILLFSMLLVCIAGINQSWATTLNLSVDPYSGYINGAYFEAFDASKAGRGIFPTFLALQKHGNSDISQGYNSDYRPAEFDEVNPATHNHSVELDWLGQIQFDSIWYYSFELDADQTGSDPFIYLEQLEIYQTNDPKAHDYSTGLGTLVYDLDSDLGNPLNTTDNSVWLDYTMSSGGSGWKDMIVNIPVASFSTDYDYVVLYSQFGNDNDGPQEWSYMAGPGAPVPEPSTILLVGTGLLGIIGFGRKRLNKKA